VEQVQEDALITLEHSDKVITIPSYLIALSVMRQVPNKTSLVPCNELVKMVVRMRDIASPTPYGITQLPVQPGAVKVCTEETIHPFPPLPTCLAAPNPLPEGKGIA